MFDNTIVAVAGQSVRAQGDALAPHGQDLPAGAEADFFQADGRARLPAALKPMMALFPRGLLFRREKNAAASSRSAFSSTPPDTGR